MGGAGAQDAKRVAGQAVVEVADYSWDQTDQDLTVYVTIENGIAGDVVSVKVSASTDIDEAYSWGDRALHPCVGAASTAADNRNERAAPGAAVAAWCRFGEQELELTVAGADGRRYRLRRTLEYKVDPDEMVRI
jgi:hypothetical protein